MTTITLNIKGYTISRFVPISRLFYFLFLWCITSFNSVPIEAISQTFTGIYRRSRYQEIWIKTVSQIKGEVDKEKVRETEKE